MIFSESLKKNRDFQTVYKYGKSAANRYLIMYIYPNQTERNRLGISVSKKVGNSVVRHRLARLIRESYRLSETRFHSGYDIDVYKRQSTTSSRIFMELSCQLKWSARSQTRYFLRLRNGSPVL